MEMSKEHWIPVFGVDHEILGAQSYSPPPRAINTPEDDRRCTDPVPPRRPSSEVDHLETLLSA
jgi:hypothetical protein